MALLGRIDSFDLKTDNITEYIERLEQYIIANDKQKANCHVFNYYWKWNMQLLKKFASTRITGRKDSKNAIRNINRPPETPAHRNCWAL